MNIVSTGNDPRLTISYNRWLRDYSQFANNVLIGRESTYGAADRTIGKKAKVYASRKRASRAPSLVAHRARYA